MPAGETNYPVHRYRQCIRYRHFGRCSRHSRDMMLNSSKMFPDNLAFLAALSITPTLAALSLKSLNWHFLDSNNKSVSSAFRNTVFLWQETKTSLGYTSGRRLLQSFMVRARNRWLSSSAHQIEIDETLKKSHQILLWYNIFLTHHRSRTP